MPPVGLTTKTLVGEFFDYTQTGDAGTLIITPRTATIDGTSGKAIITTRPIVIPITGPNYDFSIALPVDQTYRIVEQMDGVEFARTYDISILSADPATVKLRDKAPLGTIVPGTAYLTQATGDGRYVLQGPDPLPQYLTQTEGDGRYPVLSGGKVPVANIPDEALVTITDVANQTAMLALTAQRGDMARRTDQANAVYVLSTNSPSTLADWKQISVGTAASGVSSVNGETGAVTLNIDDIVGVAGTNTWLLASNGTGGATWLDISTLATAASVTALGGSVTALLARTEVVLADPGDADPGGLGTNAVIIDKAVVIDKAFRTGQYNDGQVFNSGSPGIYTSVTGTITIKARDGSETTNKELAFAGGASLQRVDGTASTIGRYDFTATTKAQAAGGIYIEALPSTGLATEIGRFTNAAGTAGPTLQLTSTGALLLRENNTTKYTFTTTFAAGDYIAYQLEGDYSNATVTLRNMQARVWKNVIPSGSNITETSSQITNLTTITDMATWRIGAITAAAGALLQYGPFDLVRDVAITIKPPHVDSDLTLGNLLRRIRSLETAAAPGVTRVRKATDTTYATTTKANDPDLVLTVSANKRYRLSGQVAYHADANPGGMLARLVAPAGAASVTFQALSTSGSATGQTASITYGGVDLNVDFQRGAAGVGSANRIVMSILGEVTVAATAGSLQWQFAMKGGTGPLIIMAESWFQIEEVA